MYICNRTPESFCPPFMMTGAQVFNILSLASLHLDYHGDMISQEIGPVPESDESCLVPVDLQFELPVHLGENLVIASRLL